MVRFTPMAVVVILLLNACSTPATRPQSATTVVTQSTTISGAPAEQLPGPDDNLNAVAWTQTAVERDLIYLQTYRMAGDELDRALTDQTWEALPKGERKSPIADPHKTAVILDIDETVLDNSPYQARLVVKGESFDKATWAEWCREESAAAVPGALDFTRLAASKGVTVFYLSNRPNDLGDVTLANLRKVGFPIAENEQVFLGLGMPVSNCEQKGSAKSCRRELISRNYRVLLQIGDQLGDLVDEKDNTPSGRQQVIAPYLDWIGERWFVLPNPTYGHWEPALFNNDWNQPPAERRRAKEAALRLN